MTRAVEPSPAPVRPTPAAREAGALAERAPLPRIFLGHVEVTRAAPGKIGGRTGAKLTVPSDVGPGDGELERRGVRRHRTPQGTEIFLPSYPSLRGRPEPQDRAASFVIDFDAASVVQAKAEAAAAHGDHATMNDLTRFVAAYITQKNLMRGFDPASVVATRREGDCTEHAVLLAALGRSFGFPARVVTGIVVLDIEGNLFAGGHAWVEWYGAGGWSCADAAIPSEHDPLYVPLHTFASEGPAFGRALLSSLPPEAGRIVVAPE
jgi:transglutaminase-like putative cysteine protease